MPARVLTRDDGFASLVAPLGAEGWRRLDLILAARAAGRVPGGPGARQVLDDLRVVLR